MSHRGSPFDLLLVLFITSQHRSLSQRSPSPPLRGRFPKKGSVEGAKGPRLGSGANTHLLAFPPPWATGPHKRPGSRDKHSENTQD